MRKVRKKKLKKLAKPILYYVHDPMCSWCWAFKPMWQTLEPMLKDCLDIRLLLGGLAIDNDDPMPVAQKEQISQIWKHIEQVVPGTRFNHEFWTKCTPKRSTYPACRAVISAGLQKPGHESVMIDAIQKAYYLDARNPSESDTLERIAGEIGLDVSEFDRDIHLASTHLALEQQIFLSRTMGVRGFPGLALKQNESTTLIEVDYHNPDTMVNAIENVLEEDYRASFSVCL